MTRDLKHVVVYGAFGLLLGAKIVEVLLTRTDTSIIDWWLLLVGVGAAIVHYLPIKEDNAPAEDAPRTDTPEPAAEEPDTLVLRDYPDVERERSPGSYPAPAGRRNADGFL